MPGPPIQAPVTTIKPEEPRVILSIEKHKVSLLIDTGASISSYSFLSWTQVLQENFCSRHIRPAPRAFFTQTIACSWGDFHSFLIDTEIPTLLLG
jgi:hypothetical protein